MELASILVFLLLFQYRFYNKVIVSNTYLFLKKEGKMADFVDCVISTVSSINNACNLRRFYTRENGLVWRPVISSPYQII